MPTVDILQAAEEIYDGWFANDERIDWDNFIDRLEKYTDHDFGNDMNSPLIKKVKQHIRRYKNL